MPTSKPHISVPNAPVNIEIKNPIETNKKRKWEMNNKSLVAPISKKPRTN
jgi:hypothetical protein